MEERTVKLYGISEETVRAELIDLINKNDVNITVNTVDFEIHIKLVGKEINKASELIYLRLGRYIYGENEDSLASVAVKLLMRKGLKVSFCESCTGGMISKAVTDISGASEVFDCGIVTYSNKMKSALVGVPAKVLDTVGAVSEETAVYMAKGIRRVANADIGISTTGIAGPGGGTLKKPVGLVYMGFSTKNSTEVFKLNFKGDRNEVRARTVKTALIKLIDYLR